MNKLSCQDSFSFHFTYFCYNLARSLEENQMILSKREAKLLEYLLHTHKAYVTRFELAEELAVSEKTIRNDVLNLNHKEKIVDVKRGSGYYLSDSEAVENILGQQPTEGWNRKVQLFKYLMDRSPCDFYELTDEFFISEGTLSNSIQQINDWLCFYDFKVKIIRKNNQLFCSGASVEKKTALRKFLLDEVVENELDIHILDGYFSSFNCSLLKDDLVNYYQQMEIPILDYSLISVLLHLLLLLDKAKSQTVDKMIKLNERPVFDQFIKNVEKHQKLLLDSQMVIQIEECLSHQQNKTVDQKSVFLSETILQLMLSEIKDNYQLDLSNDPVFQQKFKEHILQLLVRCQNRQFIKNPMLLEIKRKFSLIYDISATVIAEVQKEMASTIPEDEIGYIALHLITAIEDLKAEAITIQIVESFSQTITDFLSRLIHANFPEINIIVTPKLSFKTVTGQKVDLVLSFMPLDIIPTIPVYYLDAKLLSAGQSELMAFIRKVKYEKRFCDFKIKSYFSKDYFYPQVVVNDKKQLLEAMCYDLIVNKIVSQDFIRSVLMREAVAPTSFGGVLAIPHATKKQAKQSIISVATLKRPLNWGNDQVRIVCLFALAPDFNEADRLYSYLLNAVENEVQLEKILRVQSFTDFQKELFTKY